MQQYVDLVKKVLTIGEERPDRTGTGTKSIFGGQLEFDLTEAFPLVTIKKTLWKAAFIEMLWFIRGEPNISFLKEHGVKIWDDWADSEGNLGPVYGVQWRKWPGKLHRIPLSEIYDATDPRLNHPLRGIITRDNFVGQDEHRAQNGDAVYIYQEKVDQLKSLIEQLKSNPNSRRHIMTAWNPAFIDQMGLPPCHRDLQCYVTNDGQLDLMLSIRSWDLGLGAPFNIAQYALLAHLLGRAAGLKPRRLVINYGDAHVYLNHVEKMTELLKNGKVYPNVAKLVINTDNTDIDGYKIDDFMIEGYQSGPFVSLPIAV